MNDKGVTLIELVVYIALFSVISLLVGKQFRALTNNYSVGKRIARQQTDMRDVLGLMVREIRNTGLKVYFTGNDTTRIKEISKAGDVIVAAGTDSSSFIHTDGTPNDKLTIKKLRLTRGGDYAFTDKIDYYVNGTTLRRSLKTTDSPDTMNTVVAENVYALQFMYGVADKDSVIYDSDPINTGKWSSATGGVVVSVPASNQVLLTFAGATTGALKCSDRRTVVKNGVYNVHLKIAPSSSGFLGKIDSLRFAFRNASVYYGIESFKPYMDDMVIPVTTSGGGDADLLLEYYITGAGSLVISGVEVSRAEDSTYAWHTNPVAPDSKRNVRVIRVFALMRSAGTTATKTPSAITVGPVTVTPTAGTYTWRVFEETIETPNNGIF